MKKKSINLELVYVYIRDYKIFKNQGFCFCPEYKISCKENGKTGHISLAIEKKEDSVDLFKDHNINLTVVCGKNGCGKSTLLEALQKNDENIVRVYKDKNENFYSTEEITIKLNEKTRPVKDNNILKNDAEYKNPFAVKIRGDDFKLRNMVEYYADNPELFNGILHKTDKLFSHFRVKVWNFDDLVSKIRFDDESELLKDIKDSEFEDKYFALYALSNKEFRDKIFSDFNKNIEAYESGSFFGHFDTVLAIPKKINEQRLKLEEGIFEKKHIVKSFKNVKNSVEKLEKIYKNILKDKYSFWETDISLDSLLFYDGYFKFENSERHIDDLSSGELQEIKYRHQLFNVLKNQNACICCIDEPETHLHPEWCRCFLNDFLKSFVMVKKILRKQNDFVDRKISFVISTHSPFILSDVTNDNIIYLERQEDGTTKQVQKDKNVFAGNIGELFTANFFMNETIGEFASEKIRGVIRKLQPGETILSTNLVGCKQMIGLVGDDLLRKLLCDMWERKYEENKTER
ncbi:MAG: AAA family ATPase [Treponema sp.]|nr:AAA family ATPase [Treponema sp.]